MNRLFRIHSNIRLNWCLFNNKRSFSNLSRNYENENKLWEDLENEIYNLHKSSSSIVKLSKDEIRKYEFEWNSYHQMWAKTCGIKILAEKSDNGEIFEYKLILKKSKNNPSDLKYTIVGTHWKYPHVAKQIAFQKFYKIVKERRLLSFLGFKLITVKDFLKKFIIYALNKDENQIMSLLSQFNGEISTMHLVDLYKALLHSLDYEFSAKIAHLIYEKIKLNESEFISKEDCNYYKLNMFLLFLETMECIDSSKKKLLNTNIDVKYEKKIGEDIFIFTPCENIPEDYKSSNNTNLHRKLLPDIKGKSDHSEICKEDYVLVQSDDGSNILSEIMGIDNDYNIKLRTLSPIPSHTNFKMIKLTSSININVFSKNLKTFCTINESCCNKLRSLITKFDGDINKLKEYFDEDVIKLNNEFSLENLSITHAQKTAIISALTKRITLIQGPPGTGKTKTSAEIVRQWLNLNSDTPILVTADSNIAVDNICSELRKMKIKFLRVGANSNAEEYFGTSNKTAIYTQMKKNYKDIKVICTTCVSFSSSTLDKMDFERIIIDEAAQSTEISNISVVTRRTKQLVIIGDHKQLPPTVISKIAEENGYSLSLFERLINKGIPSILLDTQYRMHPAISEFPSFYFYESKLKSGVSPSDRILINGFPWPNKHIPVAFIDVHKGKEDKHGNSYFNDEEIMKVNQIVKTLLLAKNIRESEIGIITPYDSQKRKLLTALNYSIQKKTHGNFVSSLSNIEVDTVDGFQGKEKELIIFSAVRANSNSTVGFLNNKRRLNVMLTRARRGLIVVGNYNTLQSDEHWRNWINWCKIKNLIC